MPLSESKVMHVAKLARLALTEADARLYAEQLDAILEYAGRLSQVETQGVEALAQPLEVHNVVRADAVCPSLGTDAALRNAPVSGDCAFHVPAILGGGA